MSVENISVSNRTSFSSKNDSGNFCRHTTNSNRKKMTKIFHLISLLTLFISSLSSAQTTDSLRQEIQKIISAKNVIVGISIVGNNRKDTLQ